MGHLANDSGEIKPESALSSAAEAPSKEPVATPAVEIEAAGPKACCGCGCSSGAAEYSGETAGHVGFNPRKLIVVAVLAILAILLVLFLCGCTENSRVKRFGGSMSVDLPANTKLVTATWKESELWYLVRTRRPGETPETHFFKEKSPWGVNEGTVQFNER